MAIEISSAANPPQLSVSIGLCLGDLSEKYSKMLLWNPIELFEFQGYGDGMLTGSVS